MPPRPRATYSIVWLPEQPPSQLKAISPCPLSVGTAEETSPQPTTTSFQAVVEWWDPRSLVGTKQTQLPQPLSAGRVFQTLLGGSRRRRPAEGEAVLKGSLEGPRSFPSPPPPSAPRGVEARAWGHSRPRQGLRVWGVADPAPALSSPAPPGWNPSDTSVIPQEAPLGSPGSSRTSGGGHAWAAAQLVALRAPPGPGRPPAAPNGQCRPPWGRLPQTCSKVSFPVYPVYLVIHAVVL